MHAWVEQTWTNSTGKPLVRPSETRTGLSVSGVESRPSSLMNPQGENSVSETYQRPILFEWDCKYSPCVRPQTTPEAIFGQRRRQLGAIFHPKPHGACDSQRRRRRHTQATFAAFEIPRLLPLVARSAPLLLLCCSFAAPLLPFIPAANHVWYEASSLSACPANYLPYQYLALAPQRAITRPMCLRSVGVYALRLRSKCIPNPCIH